ncbi:MAG: hypothetical protein KME64_16330 [Scytonematopsis contorta HA4267-MV1]|nr:hypothetical protein [Scytonematopsis contorta HA4267-MV1]
MELPNLRIFGFLGLTEQYWGRLLASTSEDKTIKLWDVIAHKEIATLIGHRVGVSSVSFSPSGKLLASGSSSGTVVLWNLEILSKLTLDDLMVRGCDWVRRYLQTNPNVSSNDKHLCDGI